MKQKGVVRTSLKNTSASVESLGTQNKIELDHLRNHLVGNQNIVPKHMDGGPTTNPRCYHFRRNPCETLTSSEVAPNISVLSFSDFGCVIP